MVLRTCGSTLLGKLPCQTHFFPCYERPVKFELAPRHPPSPATHYTTRSCTLRLLNFCNTRSPLLTPTLTGKLSNVRIFPEEGHNTIFRKYAQIWFLRLERDTHRQKKNVSLHMYYFS